MEKYPQNGWFWTFLSFTHSAWVKISTFEKKLLISKKGPSCTFWILPPEEFFVKFFGKSPKIDSKINIKNKNKIDLFFSNGPKKSVGSVSHFGGGVRWRGHWHGQNAGGKWNKVAACALPCIGNARVSTLHCPKIRFKAAHPRMDLLGLNGICVRSHEMSLLQTGVMCVRAGWGWLCCGHQSSHGRDCGNEGWVPPLKLGYLMPF